MNQNSAKLSIFWLMNKMRIVSATITLKTWNKFTIYCATDVANRFSNSNMGINSLFYVSSTSSLQKNFDLFHKWASFQFIQFFCH